MHGILTLRTGPAEQRLALTAYVLLAVLAAALLVARLSGSTGDPDASAHVARGGADRGQFARDGEFAAQIGAHPREGEIEQQ